MQREHKYRECLRNHAASLGSYATDGCGEYTPDDAFPSSLQCAACGCHRNFHRKVTYTSSANNNTGGGRDIENTMELMDYPHAKGVAWRPQAVVESPDGGERSGKKRFRTKFTSEQKEKMVAFAEKLGWKLTRKDEEDEVEKFCRRIGVSRQVFKVWMHNHKRSSSSSSASTGNATSSLTTQ